MSVCVTVRTNKAVAPDDFLKELAESGEQIVVTSKEFPCVRFGNHQTALRGIEETKKRTGWRYVYARLLRWKTVSFLPRR